MLTVSDVFVKAGRRTILHGVSAAFEPGRLHLIVGPNGAGKSTLIKVLARLTLPIGGCVKYGASDASSLSHRELARRRAVLSQAVEVVFPLPVRELVMMGRYAHFIGRPGAEDERICEEAMRYFDVTELGDRIYGTLSGGEKQRVNFARVLAQVWRQPDKSCRYLFLDEPLTFLDVRHQLDFMHKVRAFADQPDTVVVGVVHDLNLAARFADRLVLIHDGGVVASGTPAEVLTTEHVRRVFQVTPFTVANPAGGQPYLFFE
jgi:iron complex transport system ATP-binding protein